jgi:alpha-tubulin suppressor-like RCC1 family protein
VDDASIDAVTVSIVDTATGLSVGGGILSKQASYWSAAISLTATGLFELRAEARRGGIVKWRGAVQQDLTGATMISIPVVAATDASISIYSGVGFVDTAGQLRVWGKNYYGYLGTGNGIDVWSPVAIGSTVYSKASFGEAHSLLLAADGSIWAMGSGTAGELGNGGTSDKLVPTKIGTDTWIDIAAGTYFSVAVRSDGTLWAWGSASGYKLGNGTTSPQQNSPIQIGTSVSLRSGEKFSRVAAGASHAFALTNQGRLYTWGTGYYGEFGTGSSGTVSTPTLVGTDSDWESVSCGDNDTLARKANGKLYGTGYNYSGELGLGNSASRYSFTLLLSGSAVKAYSVGLSHSLFVKYDGSLWACGNNSFGQVGDGNIQTKVTSPVRIGSDSDWIAVEAGYRTSLALRGSNLPYTWGLNSYGQLGRGTTSYITSPTKIAGSVSSVAHDGKSLFCVKTDGTLWVAGSNVYGQLGLGDTSFRLSLTLAGESARGGLTWTKIRTGNFSGNLFALRSDGVLYGTGYNLDGELGLGTSVNATSLARIGATDTWLDVAAGYDHALGIKSDGSLWAWGKNGYSQLGNGSTSTSTSPIQITVAGVTSWAAVAAGNYCSFARSSDGKIYAWGYCVSNRLGNNVSSGNQTTPVQINSGATWTPSKIFSGGMNGSAIAADNTLYAWGSNAFGAFGTGNSTNLAVPANLLSGGTVLAASFFSGSSSSHSLVAKSDGTLWSTGYNDYGQGGRSSTASSTNVFGQVGSSTAWRAVVAAGFSSEYPDNSPNAGYVSLALDSSGDLYAFGSNSEFQLTSAAPSSGATPQLVTYS